MSYIIYTANKYPISLTVKEEILYLLQVASFTENANGRISLYMMAEIFQKTRPVRKRSKKMQNTKIKEALNTQRKTRSKWYKEQAIPCIKLALAPEVTEGDKSSCLRIYLKKKKKDVKRS